MGNDRRWSTTSRAVAATASFVALAAATGWTSAAHAGQVAAPTAAVAAECEGELGLIVLTIADDGEFTYDIYIDGELLEADVTIDGEEELVIEVEDGDYLVEVDWLQGEGTILEETVTVECAPDETTTTTTVPAAPNPGAVVAEPDFTG
jgi:hypothetical protein